MGKKKITEIIEKDQSPIGVFDSGVGGLTVVREIVRQLPDENIVYFGDTARVPYGSKSPSTIKHFSSQIVRFLLTKNVKAIVIACNTASAVAFEELKGQFDIPIIEVVIPGAKAAIEETKNGKIAVIGTEATIKSGIYPQIINHAHPEYTVIEKACPLFVPLVEEGFREHHVTKDIIDHYLKAVKETDIDTIILGCTHYPLLRSLIKEYLGEKIHLVNPAYETAKGLERLLETVGIANRGMNEGGSTPRDEEQSESEALCQNKYEFYVSDGAEKFRQFANKVMSIEMPKIQVVNIENY